MGWWVKVDADVGDGYLFSAGVQVVGVKEPFEVLIVVPAVAFLIARLHFVEVSSDGFQAVLDVRLFHVLKEPCIAVAAGRVAPKELVEAFDVVGGTVFDFGLGQPTLDWGCEVDGDG